jgi:hypothetical protein
LRERIIDALVFGAVGSDVWFFVALVIVCFGHVYLQAQSATCRRLRPAQAGPEFATTTTAQGHSHTVHPGTGSAFE